MLLYLFLAGGNLLVQCLQVYFHLCRHPGLGFVVLDIGKAFLVQNPSQPFLTEADAFFLCLDCGFYLIRTAVPGREISFQFFLECGNVFSSLPVSFLDILPGCFYTDD